MLDTFSNVSSSVTRLVVRHVQSSFAGPFTFALHRGECIAVQGPSGAGKSVLLRMLSDLDPHGGDMLLDGHPCSSMPSPVWRSRVVYQAAEPAWWDLTVAQHLNAAQTAFVASMLPALKLEAHVLETPVDRLSTGERQRLALLRSLACKPAVLLLDEPTASLDPDSVLQVEELLKSFLEGGMAMLIVTHSPEQAHRLAHRCLRIEHGKQISP